MMKQTMLIFVCLSLLLVGAVTTHAQEGDEPDEKIWVGVGIGTRDIVGDTPAPRVGESANLLQFGVHALFALKPRLGIAADWAWGWNEIKYTSSTTAGGGSSINSKTIQQSWSLNGLITANLPVGGGLLYAGPGLAVIMAEFQRENDNNGTVTRTTAELGTNVGLVVGGGAIMPLKNKWHGFLSLRYTWVRGYFDEATTTSSVKSDVPVGGPAALVGVGYGF